MISRYVDLFPMMQPDLPGIQTPLLLQVLQQAGRDFCRSTESWIERLTFNIVDADDAYDTAYDAAIAAGQSVATATIAGDAAWDAALQYTVASKYDAECIRPRDIWITGDDQDEPIDPSQYDFDVASGVLSFHAVQATYSPVATVWATLATYAAGSCVIVSGLRYLCAIAHVAGTWSVDLAAGKWKVMPNDLLIDAILQPKPFSVELAAWYMEKFHEGIIALAMEKLCAMRNKDWSSPERIGWFTSEYRRVAALAMREATHSRDKSGSPTYSVPSWTP